MAVYLGSKMLTDLLTGDAELVPENIKEGVEVFGVQGTFKGAPQEEVVVLQTLVVAEGDDVKIFRYDGNLKKFILTMSAPAAAATIAGGAEINKAGAGGLVAYNYLGPIVNTTPVTFLCMSTECCGMDYVDFVFNNDASNSAKMATAKALNRTARVTDASIPFTRVSLYANSAFPAGTVIELRGVLADG